MKRGIIYILLILVCIYIGIINREEAYFYVAALMLAVMGCLLAAVYQVFQDRHKYADEHTGG